MSLKVIKAEETKVVKVNNDVTNLNEMLFQQLEQIKNLDVNDEKFEDKKEKIRVFAEVADRIIKNNEFGLRVQVWNAHQAFRLSRKGNYDC